MGLEPTRLAAMVFLTTIIFITRINLFVVWTIPSSYHFCFRCPVSSLYTFLFRLRSVFPFDRVHRIYRILLKDFSISTQFSKTIASTISPTLLTNLQTYYTIIFDLWLAGFQPVRNQWQFFRWSLPPMLPVSHKESIAPNHK
jgi:hypothetical protein